MPCNHMGQGQSTRVHRQYGQKHKLAKVTVQTLIRSDMLEL